MKEYFFVSLIKKYFTIITLDERKKEKKKESKFDADD